MPIKGLTDRGAAFPRIGTLRKGAEKPENSNRPGQDLDYFRFDTDDESAAKAFHDAYGDKPRDINVFLPFSTVEENFEAWQEHWVRGGLVHRCDGETCVIWRKEDGTYSREPKPCPGGCEPVGRLKVIIPELRRLAYVVVQTSSIHDIITLQENLEAASLLRGDLRGIPFVLRRRPRMVSTPEIKNGKPTGKRIRREKWLLSIEPAPSWVSLQLAAMQREALPDLAEPDVLALTAGRVVDTDTGEIMDTSQSEEPVDGNYRPSEPEQKQESAPAYKSTPRPWPADIVIEALQDAAQWAHDNGRTAQANGVFGACLGILDKLGDHHVFFERVFAVRSASDLDGHQQYALVAWMKPEKDEESGEWIPGQHVRDEIAAVMGMGNGEQAQIGADVVGEPA